jgi:hypothetical protein
MVLRRLGTMVSYSITVHTLHFKLLVKQYCRAISLLDLSEQSLRVATKKERARHEEEKREEKQK